MDIYIYIYIYVLCLLLCQVDQMEFLCPAAGGAPSNRGKLVQPGPSPLYVAALQGHLDVVHCLAERGADKDRPPWHGATPLHASAQQGHVDVVRYLCAARADVDCQAYIYIYIYIYTYS